MLRALVVILVFASGAFAQLPKEFYAWWNSPVAERLNLNLDQRRNIRQTVREYRPHLLQLRAAIDQAELDLETQFNQDAVDQKKANDAIERLAVARGDLTRTLAQMSLKLRAMLTQEQWQELQRRRPAPRGKEPQP